MASWSRWEIHPKLKKALDAGMSVEEWLDGRRPIASYARISHDINDSMGVKRQHENTDEFAEANDLAVTMRYTDNDITAADPDIERPAFLRMVRDLRARRSEEGIPVQGVICVEEFRVVRLPEDYLRLYRALTVDEHATFAITDTKTLVDVNSDSEILRGLLNSAFGELEVRKIKHRRSRNARDLALEGQPAGRPRFGWLPADPKTERPANKYLNPAESPHLRHAIEMRLKKKSWKSIVLYLRPHMAELGKSEKIAVSNVQYMVTNPANCGYRMLNGELIRNRETGEPVIGDWETICTPQEWEQLVRDCPTFFDPFGLKKPKDKKSRAKRSRKERADDLRKFLLAGFCRCGRETEEGICYGRMVGSTTTAYNGTKQAKYRCSRLECGRLARRVDLVDKTVETIAIKVIERQYKHKKPEEKEWYGEETLRRLRERKTKLKERYKQGGIDDDDFFDLLDILDQQIKDSEKDRADFYAEQAGKNMLSGFTAERWKDFDMRQKRLAIETVMRAVIIKPIPPGRSRRAPFDPELIVPVWNKKSSVEEAA